MKVDQNAEAISLFSPKYLRRYEVRNERNELCQTRAAEYCENRNYDCIFLLSLQAHNKSISYGEFLLPGAAYNGKLHFMFYLSFQGMGKEQKGKSPGIIYRASI